jgi:hypothetical protein
MSVSLVVIIATQEVISHLTDKWNYRSSDSSYLAYLLPTLAFVTHALEQYLLHAPLTGLPQALQLGRGNVMRTESALDLHFCEHIFARARANGLPHIGHSPYERDMPLALSL